MHFGENQLSPGSIGISPLTTGHPPVLQHGWVRASTRSHPRFTLPMASSPGFGPTAGDLLPQLTPSSDSLSLRLHGSSPRCTWGAGVLPTRLGRRHYLAGSFFKRHAVTRGPPLRKGRAPPIRLRLLAGVGVQALFHPPRGVLFTLPSRYSFTIGGQEYS